MSANPCVRRDPASPPTRVQGLKGPDLRVCGPGSADCSLLSLFCVCSGRRDHLPAADLPAGRAADCTALPRGRPGWCRIASPERAADSLLHGRGPHWAVFHPDCFGGCAGGVWCPAVSFPCLCRIPFTRAVGGAPEAQDSGCAPARPPRLSPCGLLTSAFCLPHFPTPVLTCAPSTPPSPTCVVWKSPLAVLWGLCSVDSPFRLQASCFCDLSQGKRRGPESAHTGISSLGGFGAALSLLAPCLRVDVGLWTRSCSSSEGRRAVLWVLT